MEKICTVKLPLEVNHEIRLIQQQIEKQQGIKRTLAELVVMLVQEALESRKVEQVQTA